MHSTESPAKKAKPTVEEKLIFPEGLAKLPSVLGEKSNIIKLIVFHLTSIGDAQELAKYLKNNKQLTILQFESCRINDELFAVLADGFMQNESLQRVSIDNEGESRVTVESFSWLEKLSEKKLLRQVVFVGSSFASNERDELLKQLFTTKHLPVVDIEVAPNHRLFVNLFKLHPAAEQRKQLKVSPPCLSEKYRSYLYWRLDRFSDIEEFHCSEYGYLVLPLQPNTAPKRYSDAVLTDELCVELLGKLKQHQELYLLNLSGNNLTDNCMPALLELLKTRRIFYLDISNNKFSDSGMRQFSEYLKQDKNLITLNLSGNPVSDSGTAALVEALENNRTLVTANLPGRQNKTPDLNKINAKNETNKKAVISAVVSGDLQKIITLLGEGVSPYISNEKGNTLLHLAVKHKYPHIVSYLLWTIGVNRTVKNKNGRMAYTLASKKKNKSHQLLACFENSQTVSVDLQRMPSPNKNSRSPRKDIVFFSQQASAVANSNNNVTVNNNSFPHVVKQFYFAAYYGDKIKVAKFLAEGVSVNARIASQETALHAAAQMGHGEVVRLLITNNANANVGDSLLRTPLHLACYNHNPKITSFVVSELLKAEDIDLNALDDCGYSALYCAIGGLSQTENITVNDDDHVAIVWQLIKKGADPALTCFDYATETDGMTALHKAAMLGEYKMVQALLSHAECPVSAKNSRGRTALDEAIVAKHWHIVDRLLIDPRFKLSTKENQQTVKLIENLAEEKPNDQNIIAIKRKIDARLKQKSLGFSPKVRFTNSLDFFYSRKDKPPLSIEGDEEHKTLKKNAHSFPDAGDLAASLTLIVQRSDNMRRAITVELHEPESRLSIAWQDYLLKSESRRSQELSEKLLARYDNAPYAAKQNTTQNIDDKNKFLNQKAITSLFSEQTINAEYKKLFHHEMNELLNFLEEAEIQKMLVQEILKSSAFEPGCKVLPEIILRIHSVIYIDGNTAIGIFGEQNTERSLFLKGMEKELEQVGCRLSKYHPMRMVVAVSAEKPGPMSILKKPKDHKEIPEIDLRNHYDHAFIKKVFVDQPNIQDYFSTKPKNTKK